MRGAAPAHPADAPPRRRGLAVVVARRCAARVFRATRRGRLGLGSSCRLSHGRNAPSRSETAVQPFRADSSSTDAESAAARPRPAVPAQLVSRRGGAPAWCPDGRKIAIAEFPPPDPSYNGNPLRNADDPPPLFSADAFRLWIVDAPLPVDSNVQRLAADSAPSRRTPWLPPSGGRPS